jgi:hypothetical protein
VTLLDLLQTNLLSPMVLAFVLGVTATLLKSDLKFPDEVYTALSIYLLFAIGLKGGAELSETTFAQFWAPALVTLLLGVAVPLWCYAILRRLGRFDVPNAAALAAHYGSVSAVTFSASLIFLESVQVTYEGFLPTLVALLEVPAIVIALVIARRQMSGGTASTAEIVRELLTSKSIVLLLGGLVIGFLSGKAGVEQVAPFFVHPFRGALTLFMLEMGMVAAQRFRDFGQVGVFLAGFGIVMPALHGALGVWLGALAGLSLGGSMVFGVLAASASYIAAPAAVRLALPQANPSYYLTASLAITFPFNLALGLPLYFQLAQLIHGG